MTRPRSGLHVPITPSQGGQPPGFVVACLDCGFSVDAHGQDAEAAVLGVAPSHQAGHRLTAQPVDYATGYGDKGTDPHTLYA